MTDAEIKKFIKLLILGVEADFKRTKSSVLVNFYAQEITALKRILEYAVSKGFGKEMTVVKELDSGVRIYKHKNEQIGGYDYYSDAVAGGYLIAQSLVSPAELEAVVEDMRKEEQNE